MFTPFTLPDRIEIYYAGPEQMPEARLSSPGGEARISLHGAQVLSYHPADDGELLWLSPNMRYQPGTAIRGGIPICWPWFGAHPDNDTFPAHGFARTSLWEVRSSFADTHLTQLKLGLTHSDASFALWPYRFDLELCIELDHNLRLTLRTRNDDDQPFILTEALHSYFVIDSINHIQIKGLAACRYRDKLDAMAQKPQVGEMQPQAPFDRVYEHDGSVRLIDEHQARAVRIDKDASQSTIVWNPGPDAGAGIADIGPGNSEHFVCIEAGNALEAAIELAPGESHTLSMTLRGEALDSGV